MIDEKTDTFIDFEPADKYRLFNLPKTHEFIFTSEESGWTHAYLYNADTGKKENAITLGSWVLREVSIVYPEARQLWFKAGGLVEGEDPYQLHQCRVNLDGTGFADMTPGSGTHEISSSTDGKYYLDTYSRLDKPWVTELRRGTDFSKACTVEEADFTAREKAGWQTPECFVAKGRDGKTDIYGAIYRPTNFDSSKKYPVLESVYAGPQVINTPKRFLINSREMQLAGSGFIVVQCDGMGTNFRSKAFHDVCFHNMMDAGFSDRIAWIKAAASKHPQMDLARVGIYGGSTGGGNAVRALESHADFYKAAVAEAGTYDGRVLASSEYWMGWPAGKWYEEQSEIAAAGKLTGRLMLMVEELDPIVDPACTMQMAAALIKNGKDFELVVIPNAGHGECGEFGDRKRRGFLTRALGVK